MKCFESFTFWPVSVIPLLKRELNHNLLVTGLVLAVRRESKKKDHQFGPSLNTILIKL
jgi:hypothetical protein